VTVSECKQEERKQRKHGRTRQHAFSTLCWERRRTKLGLWLGQTWGGLTLFLRLFLIYIDRGHPAGLNADDWDPGEIEGQDEGRVNQGIQWAGVVPPGSLVGN
jgi:hypothetical protein